MTTGEKERTTQAGWLGRGEREAGETVLQYAKAKQGVRVREGVRDGGQTVAGCAG